MRFMAVIVFKASARPEDLVPHVAAEQARVAALTREGSIVGGHLSADRRRGWLVMHGADVGEVEAALATLPLRPFMDVELVALAEPQEAAS